MADEKCTKCGRKVDDFETPCAMDDGIVCRECHDKLRPICPNCQMVLNRPPASKSKCPSCGKVILLRKAQYLFASVYLTLEQGREAERYQKSWAASHGVKPEEFARVKRDLEHQLGRTPLPDDVIEEAGRRAPATEAQVAFAKDVGLKMTSHPKFLDVSWSLTAYQQLVPEISLEWSRISDRNIQECATRSTSIGEFVSLIVEDSLFKDAVAASKCDDAYDTLRSSAVTARVRDLLILHRSRYFARPI